MPHVIISSGLERVPLLERIIGRVLMSLSCLSFPLFIPCEYTKEGGSPPVLRGWVEAAHRQVVTLQAWRGQSAEDGCMGYSQEERGTPGGLLEQRP